MATDLFDPAQINAAVGEVFGARPQTGGGRPHPFAMTPNLEGLNPELSGRLKVAQEEYRKRFGKDLPITSGVRTRADQQRLYDRWKAGDKNIFMPLNPADYPDRKVFHEDAIDVPTSVSEDFLKEFGIHRPLGKRDPVHAVAMGGFTGQQAAPQQVSQPQAAQTPGQLTVDDLMKPDAINAAVSEVFGEPPKKGKVSQKVTELLRGGAALADTLYGVVPGVAGMATYAGARAVGQTPEQAAQTKETVTGVLEKPFGKALGVIETPEYKGEASQQLMEFIGKNVDKGADWISKETGMPKADVQYYMEMGMTAVPFTKPARTIASEAGQAAGYVGGKAVDVLKQATPEPVQRGVTRAVEAVAPGTTTMPTKAPTLGVPQPGQPGQPVPSMATPQRGSMGAMGVPDATIVSQALQSATPEFQNLYGNMRLDKVNIPVVMRHLEADSLDIPIRLTKGQGTGDVVQLSKEQNVRGAQPELAYRLNEQNQLLVDNLQARKERAAPDVYATKTIESSQAIIDAYKALDDARSTEVSAAYKALEDAAGGQFPVDGQAIVRNADALLAKKLKSNFVPPEIAADLKRFREGEPMTFEQFEALRTNLAAEGRKAARAGDGNREAAVKIIRQAMEDLPLKGEAANLKPIADKARTLSKARFDALKKDPAYKAAVDDAVPADKFFDKFVINGVNKNINTMVDTLGRDSVAHQHMRAGAINWLSDKAGIVDGKGNFSQANYNKALKRLDDVNNFGVIFDPESQLKLKTLGNVAGYTQFQPRGSFVNNSNTLVGHLANKAEQAGNIVGLGKFGIPAGTIIRQKYQASKEKRFVKESLKPGAGSTLDEISKTGQ